MKILLCLAVSLACYVDSFVLQTEKCSLSDNNCMKEQFQKAVPAFMSGIPELGIQVLDVMDLDDLKFDLSGLQFSLKDGTLKGLKNSVVDSVNWQTDKKTFEVVYHMPECVVKGHYNAGGRILILPITGDGDMKLKLKNIQIVFNIDYEIEKGSDGKDYVVPKKLHFDFDVKDNANYQLTNLFNGNKELSLKSVVEVGETMLKFLNENWKQISTEFGTPLLEIAAKILYKNVRTFFKKNPLADIANI